MSTRRSLSLAVVTVALVACARPDDGTTPVPAPARPVVAATAPASEVVDEAVEATTASDEGYVFAGATYVKLPVKHQSQLLTCGNGDNWCCGIAAVNMGTAYLWGATPQTAYLTKGQQLLGLDACCHRPDGSKGTNFFDQASVAKNVGNAKGSYAACLTFDGIKAIVRSGVPVVVELMYGQIAKARRCGSGTFTGPHSAIVVGFDEGQGVWFVNDPLCSGGPSTWPSAEFRAALTANRASCAEAVGVFLAK
jgi:hypothetical protein